MAPKGEIIVHVCGQTDVGRVRNHNEDTFLLADLNSKEYVLEDCCKQTYQIKDLGVLLVVCDGMGGAAAGEVASKMAVNTIYKVMHSRTSPFLHKKELIQTVLKAIESANKKIFLSGRMERFHRGMGTTVTAAVIMNETAIFAQIGDSRGYIIRKGKIIRATKDQSLVSQLIEAGHLSEEEAQTFEHSNIILQAVGTQEEITIDITYTELKQDDIMVLCTDGLYIHLNDEKIKELAEKFEPEEACRSLTRLANEKGGQDNITVIVAQFKGKGLSLPDEKETVEIKRYKHLRIPPESPTEESPPQKIKEEKREIKAKSKLKIPVTIGTIISLFILFLYLGTHYIKNITESRVVTFPPPKQSHSLKVKKDIPKDFKSQIKQKQKIKKDKSTILDFQPLPPPKEKKKIAPKTIPLRKKPKPLTQKKILKPQKPKVKEPTESKKEPSFPGPLPRPNPY